MTRFIWDKFSKDFLETLLSPYGTVVVSKEVTSEIQEIDGDRETYSQSRCSDDQLSYRSVPWQRKVRYLFN